MIKRALPMLAFAALFASTNLTVNAQSKGDQAGSPRHGCPGEPDKSGRPGAAFVSLPKDIMAAEAQGKLLAPPAFSDLDRRTLPLYPKPRD
jgi:hypothetical protein